jgi:hypothetical protein
MKSEFIEVSFKISQKLFLHAYSMMQAPQNPATFLGIETRFFEEG